MPNLLANLQDMGRDGRGARSQRRNRATVGRFSPANLVDGRKVIEAQRLVRSPDPGRTIELEPGPPSAQVARIAERRRADGLDLVVADCILWHPAWTSAHLRSLAEALGGDGWLLFLEPVVDLGWRERIANQLVKRDIDRHGHAFTTDVPQNLRDAGLVVTTTVRFESARRLTYAWGEARNFPSLT